MGEEESTFISIYKKLKRIKERGETNASQEDVECEIPQLALPLEEEAVLARICRHDTESSDYDTGEPKYQSELQRRMNLAQKRKKTASRPLLADSHAFDVGIVQDKYGEDVSAEPLQHSFYNLYRCKSLVLALSPTTQNNDTVVFHILFP
jgi:hypothetical protein